MSQAKVVSLFNEDEDLRQEVFNMYLNSIKSLDDIKMISFVYNKANNSVFIYSNAETPAELIVLHHNLFHVGQQLATTHAMTIFDGDDDDD